MQGPYDRIRLLDAKWSETPGSGAFSSLEKVAALLTRADGIEEVEVAVVSRTQGIHQLRDGRQLVSGFELEEHLAR